MSATDDLPQGAPSRFDLCGALPYGTTVLEASAGTGKTFTITALASRYVADGVPLDSMLLVTFTRMATGELRERVRERLVRTEHALRTSIAGAAQEHDDEVLELLSDGSCEELTVRCQHLARAVSDFDAATIATTHGFCQEVLSGLGIASDIEHDVTLEEDLSPLVEEVVDDLYVRRYYRGGPTAFDRTQALLVAKAAISNPATRLEPSAAPDWSIAATRSRLARRAIEEFERRKRRLNIITYDDLLTRLDDALSGEGGIAAAQRLRARYSVVLVDEFQDTDPIQWDIVRRAFGDPPTTLVLVGDPKQAIYAFRGADVYAYLAAAKTASTRATLETNWRSDAGLISAYDALFQDAKLGHEGIAYRTVRAAQPQPVSRLTGAPASAPLRVRLVHRDEPTINLTNKGFVSSPSARDHIARDLAADIVALLSSQATIPHKAPGGGHEPMPIRPGDVAVLVRTHRNAELVRQALDEARIPAVINGAGSVFGALAARNWLRLLEALERPASSIRARTAALTAFFGWSAQRVACAAEDDWEQIHRRLHHWARILRSNGVAALAEAVSLAEGLPREILRFEGGERQLTDIRHVAQLLHAEATNERLGITALASWLRARIAAAELETGDEARSRRLESDAQAVQVLTIHRSKGLEFPVVYCPYLWEPGYINEEPVPVFFHDPEAQDERTVDVALEGPDFQRHQLQHLLEQRGEELRLAYVALTRARHQATIWWAPSWESRNSPLGRLLFGREANGGIVFRDAPIPKDEEAEAYLQSLAAAAEGNIGVERSRLGPAMIWAGVPTDTPELAGADFARVLDWRWRRTSYSDITAGAHDASVASEPELSGSTDEPPTAGEPGAADDSEPETSSPVTLALTRVPVGFRVGTFVHAVLQSTDFAAADLQAELREHVARALADRFADVGDESDIVAGLHAAIATPLGEVLGGARLRDLARSDRLDELEFELPLVGGERPTGQLGLSALATVIREHAKPGEPIHGYAERLSDPSLRQSVRGYLTGTIDLVGRLPGSDGRSRFAVVDYKTNWLAPPGVQLDTRHYRPVALAAEMHQSHYLLQALLYTVALHRYLRWRLADYNAARDLAGVLYLFLRGMGGPDTPMIEGVPCGVFFWRAPHELVEALSDVLDRGALS
jgi:exodeoxyribonuclease V beta subunit